MIQLSSCLARLAAAEDGVEFRGSKASKTSRMASMPRPRGDFEAPKPTRYLILQLQRYYVDEKWCPAKLDCKVPMRPGAEIM